MEDRSRLEIAVPAAILVLILAVTWTLYRPEREELFSLARGVVSAEDNLTYVLNHGDDLERAAAYLPRAPGEEGDGDQRFLLGLSSKLRELGLTPRVIQPLDEARDGEFMKRSYMVEIDGGYMELVELLEYLETIPELVLIETLDVKSSLLMTSTRHQAVIEITFVGH